MRNEAELSKSNTCEAWGHMWDRYAQLASLFFKLDNIKELVGGANGPRFEPSLLPHVCGLKLVRTVLQMLLLTGWCFR